jgi:hypothetical protein
MTQFYVTLGDECSDGHGKFSKEIVEVPDQFDLQTLHENYRKNVDLFGFDIQNIAADYEDSCIDPEYLDNLLELGFTSDSDSIGYYTNHPEDEDDCVNLCIEGYTDIFMFFIGYGLEGFEWTMIEKPRLEELTPSRGMFGYGLFCF